MTDLSLIFKVFSLLLSHLIQLVRHLYLPLSLRFLCLSPAPLLFLLTQSVESGSGVPHLGQLVLQSLIMKPEYLIKDYHSYFKAFNDVFLWFVLSSLISTKHLMILDKFCLQYFHHKTLSRADFFSLILKNRIETFVFTN